MKYVIKDPKVCHGKPVFKGTRIMVWQVLEMLAAGEKVNDILKSYPSLTKEMIEEALSYAAEILKGEHAKSP
jgi:uncharacterized protein (DUF433 family)